MSFRERPRMGEPPPRLARRGLALGLTSGTPGAAPIALDATSIRHLGSSGSRPNDRGAGRARSPAGPASPRSFVSPDVRSGKPELQAPPSMSRRRSTAPRDKFPSACRHLSSSPQFNSAAWNALKPRTSLPLSICSRLATVPNSQCSRARLYPQSGCALRGTREAASFQRTASAVTSPFCPPQVIPTT